MTPLARMADCLQKFRPDAVQFQFAAVVIRDANHCIRTIAQRDLNGLEVFILGLSQFINLGPDAVVFHVVLYQHHAALALGISSYGTAVTLSAMMAGMGLGGLFAAALARRGRLGRPLRAYGIAESDDPGNWEDDR